MSRETALDPTGKESYRRLALPTEHSPLDIQQLIRTGYDTYKTSQGDTQGERLIKEVEQFALNAFHYYDGVLDESDLLPLETPGQLALLSTYSAIIVKQHGQFEPELTTGNEKAIQLLHDVREYYTVRLVDLIEISGMFEEMIQEIGEVLYQKDVSDVEFHHPGRVVADVRVPDGCERYHLEIPMVAASQRCLHYDGDDRIPENLDVFFRNNHVYVPVMYIDEHWEEYLKQGFKHLLQVQEEQELSDNEILWLAQNESRITKKINRYRESSDFGRLYTTEGSDWNKIQFLRSALEESDEITPEPETYFTANQILSAVTDYDAEYSNERRQKQQLDTEQKIGSFLGGVDHPLVVVEETHRRKPNHYWIQQYTGPTPISIVDSDNLGDHDLEQIFQLPCMANMDEHLSENEPVRKDLWNFVRMLMWLPPYYEHKDAEKNEILIDKLVSDVHDLFDRWDWYNPEITEEQTRYEYQRGERPGNDRYLPMSCNNDDMREYCIGRDKCEFSIYGSLPFVDAMYAKLDEEDPGF